MSARVVDAVVFDYGGVLTLPVRESIDAWLEADGIDPASFSRTLKAWLSRGAQERSCASPRGTRAGAQPATRACWAIRTDSREPGAR